jgi:aspartate aminotransferase
MSVANTIKDQLERSSWIRRMFEEGIRLKAERGAENVYDFTLGNPEVEPPRAVLEALRRVVLEERPHGYMPNAGFPPVRDLVARKLAEATSLPYTANHILMTVGSSGAINTFLKSILDPGDEVIVPVPCFSEYQFYISNHAGRMVTVETDEHFNLDVERIAAAITSRTRAIILNSPHNPTGVIYPAETLAALNRLVESLDHPVTVISDEPYKALVYDNARMPETAALISRCVVCNSWSKSAAISGERIGYLAISPRIPEWDELRNACTFTNRILGFINAPAIWQWVISEAFDATVDVCAYQEKRDILCDGLSAAGYDVRKPQATFYVFAKTPMEDDIAFIRLLAKEGVLAVPGTGFGRRGYMRLSLTVPRNVVVRSIPAFARVMESL